MEYNLEDEIADLKALIGFTADVGKKQILRVQMEEAKTKLAALKAGMTDAERKLSTGSISPELEKIYKADLAFLKAERRKLQLSTAKALSRIRIGGRRVEITISLEEWTEIERLRRESRTAENEFLRLALVRGAKFVANSGQAVKPSRRDGDRKSPAR